MMQGVYFHHSVTRLMIHRIPIFIVCCILLLQIIPYQNGGGVITVSAQAPLKFPYLYATADDANASLPVIEHIAPVPSSTTWNRNEPDVVVTERPNFLYDKDIEYYRIVEFYVHWCDICKLFKPHFVQFAKRIKELISKQQQTTSSETRIEVYSISCTPNRAICLDHSAVAHFPIIRLYKPYDIVGTDLLHTQIHPIRVLEKFGIPLEGLEDEEYDDNFEIDPDRDSAIVAMTDQEVDQPVKLSWYEWMFGVNQHRAENVTLTKQKNQFQKRSRDELKHDVLLSFDFAMRNGIYISNDALSDERKLALLNWLKLLRHTVPASWTVLRALVQTLLGNFEHVSRSEEYLNSALDNVMIDYAESIGKQVDELVWSEACSHGDTNVGYTCGLWLLFHVVTVGVVDFNRLALQDYRLPTENVSVTIREYIDSFFGCEVCRVNFLKEFDACGQHRCTRLRDHTMPEDGERHWMELPLWLLETHNSVNVRLMKEKASRENREHLVTIDDELAVQWPPENDCQRCWSKHGGRAYLNKVMTYKYLKLEYGQRDEVTSEYREELFAPNQPEVVAIPSDNNATLSILAAWNDSNNTVTETELPWVLQKILDVLLGSKEHAAEAKGSTVNEEITPEDVENNVHVSFDFSLRHYLFHSETDPVSPKKKVLLTKFLKLMRKTLPPNWSDNIRDLLQDLIDNIKIVTANKKELIKILDTYLAEDQKWSKICPEEAIIGDTDVSRGGYMCGIWLLFHSVTVGVVDYNKRAPEFQQLTTMAVAQEIGDFVSNLLGCTVCAENFLESLEECENPDRKCGKLVKEEKGTEDDWVQLSLWLHDAHNYINTRLSKRKGSGSGTGANDVVWPSKKVCPLCWDEEGKLRDDTLFKFLRIIYGRQDELYTEYRKELAATEHGNRNPSHDNNDGTKNDSNAEVVLAAELPHNTQLLHTGALVVIYALSFGLARAALIANLTRHLRISEQPEQLEKRVLAKNQKWSLS